ncbi:MAG: magnesium transporter [Vicinamibacteria bacterium]|jgi:magnesium transporter|nr:magnesium transporter [Vicinamibacteria bacterium]
MPDQELLDDLRNLDPRTAAERLWEVSDATIAGLLGQLPTGLAVDILEEFAEDRRLAIAEATPFGQGQLWLKGHSYPDDTVGRLMERPPAVFRPDETIAAVTETLRETVKKRMVIYILVTTSDGRLAGLVAFRELLFARPEQTLAEVMIADPFHLKPEAKLQDAMREVVTRHFPIYPVCDAEGHLLGVVRGQTMFEEQAFEISAQAGAMVGVEKEERVGTPFARSFKFRHPWLQLNLLTAFVAAAVVGLFEHTLEQIVVLAVFLPVLAGQSGNTGCQALAVTLRAMTLGELRPDQAWASVLKEGLLGLCNGAVVGLVAGAGMWAYASGQGNPHALGLGLIVVAAMALSCVISGVSGAVIPLTLKRLGADPATASSIFLTTATDVVSMGAFLGLATAFLL